jgi:hypothetical protein
MNFLGICILSVVAAFTAFVIYRAKQNDRLGAMTESELLEESFWAQQDGNGKNIYSRELERRQQPAPFEPEVDQASIALDQA